MSSVVEIEGLLGWAALAGPLVVLAAALMMALLWPHAHEATLHGNSLNETVASATATQGTASESGISNLRGTQSGEVSHQISMEQPEPVQLSSPTAITGEAATVTEDIDIDLSLREAKQLNVPDAPSPATETAAGRALVEEALRERANGNEGAAAECLRGAIMLATKVGDRTLHAAARLELGDICHAEGDLQTACEHWQLARSLFEEDKLQAQAAKCETRMTKNRCPTDWVLTDF